jgi:hypothetical protein
MPDPADRSHTAHSYGQQQDGLNSIATRRVLGGTRVHAWQSNLVASQNLGTGPQRKKTAPTQLVDHGMTAVGRDLLGDLLD